MLLRVDSRAACMGRGEKAAEEAAPGDEMTKGRGKARRGARTNTRSMLAMRWFVSVKMEGMICAPRSRVRRGGEGDEDMLGPVRRVQRTPGGIPTTKPNSLPLRHSSVTTGRGRSL